MATELNLDLLKPFSNKDLDTSDANMEDPLAQELDNGTDPKKKKKASTTPTKPVTTNKPAPSGAIVVNENEETPVINPPKQKALQGGLNYANDLFNKPTSSTLSKITVDKDDYKDYVNTGIVTNTGALNKARAVNQSNWEQLHNAVTRVGLKIAPEIIKQLASVIDVEDYANSDKEVGNAVMRYMTELQEGADKLAPIYRENPNESFDLGDPAYWLEHGSNLVNSVGAFMATGYLTGGGSALALTKAAKGVKGFIEAKKAYNTLKLANIESGLGKGVATRLKDIIGGNVKAIPGLLDDTARLSSNTQRGVNAASTVASSIMLNQAEAAGVGVEVFQKAYDLEVLRLKASEDSLNMTDEEINEQAKTVAANKATEAINFNRLNIALNLSSAAQFLKPIGGTRALKEMPKRFSDLKTMGLEAGQEALEENVNFIAEKRALADKYNFSDYINDSFTAEGLEAAALGAIGGAGQQGMMSAFKHLKSYENKAYTEAFSNAYVDYRKQGLTDADATAKAKLDAVAKVGSDKERLTYNELQKQSYDKQQDIIKGYETLGKTGKATDFGTAMMSAEATVNLYEEIAIAKSNNDIAKVKELQKQLLVVRAEDAFELGTTESLLDLYKSLENLSEDEAKARFGEDSVKPGEENYKTKAKEAQKEILALEKLYNESGQYYNSREVYSLNRNKKLYTDALEKVKKDIFDRETEMDYEGTKSYKNNLVQVQEEYASIAKEIVEYEKAQKYFELDDDKRTKDPKLQELKKRAEETQSRYKSLKETQSTGRKTDKKLSTMIDTYEELADKLRETLKSLDEVTDAEYQRDLKVKADARRKKNSILEKMKSWTKRKADKEKETTNAETQNSTTQNTQNPPTSQNKPNSATSSNSAPTPSNSQSSQNSSSNQSEPIVNDFDTGKTRTSEDDSKNKEEEAPTSPVLNNNVSTDNLTDEQRTDNLIKEKTSELSFERQTEIKAKENLKKIEEVNGSINQLFDYDIKNINDNLKKGYYKEVLSDLEKESENSIIAFYYDIAEFYSVEVDKVKQDKTKDDTTKAKEVADLIAAKKEIDAIIDEFNNIVIKIKEVVEGEKAAVNTAFEVADEIDETQVINKGGQPNPADTNPDEISDLDPDEKEALEEEQKIEQVNVAKGTQVFRKFGNFLNLLQKRGVDINAFKAVVLEWESLIGREKFLTQYEDLYNKVRRFYNVTMNTDITDSYYVLMNDSPISQKAKEIRKDIKYYNIEEGLYHNLTDSVSQQELEVYNELAKNRGFVLTQNGMAYENYQEEGHSKVAYLARPYKDAFRMKTKDGINYVYYTHQDTGDNINLEIAEELLDPSLLKPGTVLELKAVDSYVDDNGNTILASTLVDAEKPIALFLNNKQLKGGYLHNSSWITRKNIRESVTDEELSADRDNLEQIKQLVLRSNKPVKIKVARRESGVPIKTAGNVFSKTMSDVLPDVKIGIIADDKILVSKGNYIASKNAVYYKPGQIVNLIPINGELVPMPSKRKKLEQDDIESITSAMLIYMNSEKSTLYEEIKKTYQLDLHKAQDLKDYLKTFVFISNKTIKTEEEFDIKLSGLDTNIPTINFEGSTLYYSFGQGLNKEIIKKGNKITRRDLDNFATFLTKSYINFDMNNMNDTKKVFHIVDNQIKSFNGSYEQFIKTKLLVNNMGIVLPSGKTIYTIQGTIELNTEELLGSKKIKRGIGTGLTNKANYIVETITDNETGEEKQVLVKTKEEEVIEVEEEEDDFSFDDDYNPMEKDYNPIEDNVKAELVANYPFIVGLPELDSFVETVIVDVVDELLLNKDDKEYKLDVQSSIKLRIEKIAIMLKNNIADGKLTEEQTSIISNKIALLKSNNDKIKKLIEDRLNQRASILKKLDKVLNVAFDENDNEDGEDTEGTEDMEIETAIERNIYSDILKYSIDPKTGLTDDLKLFLFKINEYAVSKKTGKLVRTTNGLGLPNYVSADEVYNTLLNLIAKSNTNYTPVTYNNILVKLTEASVGKPYLVDVLAKLKKIDDDAKADKKSNAFKNRFTRAFDLTLTHHIYYDKLFSKNKGGKKIIEQRLNNSSQDDVDNLLIAKWQQVAKTRDIWETINGIARIKPEFIKQFNETYEVVKNKPTYENLSRWLNSIGIKLTQQAYNDMNNNGVPSAVGGKSPLSNSINNKGGIFYHIKEQVNKTLETNQDEDSTLNNKVNLFGDNAFKRLASYLVKFDNSLSNLSHKNTEGNTIYGVIKNKAFTNRFFKLKGKEMDLKYLYDISFSKDSLWLQNLIIKEKNEEGADVYRLNEFSDFYKVFQYNTAEGIAKRGNRRGKSIGKLTEQQMEEYKLSLFANQGYMISGQRVSKVFFPTMSNKENKFTLQSIFKHYKLNDGELHEKDAEELVRLLFYPEFQRVLYHQDNKDKINNPEFLKGGGKLFLFPFLNKVEELWEEKPDGSKILRESAIYPDNLGILTSSLKGFLNKLIADRIETWENNGIITTEGKKEVLNIDNRYKVAHKDDTIKETAFNFEITNIIANVNIKQLFTGDPATYYKGHGKDENGKVILNENGKPKIPDYVATAVNEGKRFAMYNGDMNTYSNEVTETFDYLVIADREVASNILDTYLKSLKLSDKDIKAYSKINTADASEFVTLKEYLVIKVLEGDITEEDANKIQKEYDKSGKVTKEGLNVLTNAILNAVKPLYAGNRKDKAIELPLYVKSAAIPLIREMVNGKELSKLLDYVEDYEKKNKTTLRVAFESAVKLGQPKVITDIFNTGGEIIIPKDVEKSILKGISRQGHGEQNVVPYDSTANKVIDGSQQSKQLMLDILDEDGFLHEDLGTEPVTGRELNSYYQSLYKKLFKLKQDQLIKEIGFDEKTGIISNIKKLQKILLEEAKGLSINDREFLSLNEKGTDFKYPLFLTSQEKKIASLLNSIVDNRVRKRKFRGKSLVLSSEVGLNPLKSIDSLTSNQLAGITPVGNWNGILNAQREEDGKIKYAEVLVPFKFWDKNNKLLKLKDFMNDDGTVDLNRLPEELLNSFGYRIPTSGLNSMSTIRIVGFLPESMGDVVVATKDFVVQMGSDFDVDKLYTHLYNTILSYNEDGKPVLSKIRENHIEERKEFDNNIYAQRNYIAKYKKLVTDTQSLINKNKEELKPNDALLEKNLQVYIDKVIQEELILGDLLEEVKDYNTVAELEEMLLQNKILSVHESVFSNPNKNVQRKRARAISFGNLPKLAEKIFNEDVDYFSTVTVSYQTKKYLSARTGSSATGVFANTATFNAVVQQVENEIAFRDKEGKRIYHIIAGLQSTNLNTPKTNTGGFKSQVIEAFLSAAVDDEKEQLLSKLNINRQTFDVINAMALQGYDEEIIITFINQPIIKWFTGKQKKNDKKAIDNTERIINDKVDMGFLENVNYDDLFELAYNNEFFEDETTMLNNALQKAVITKFFQLQSEGSLIKDVVSAINSDTKGAGKSYFFSIKKTAQILTLPSKNISLSNISDVIGEYTTIHEESKKRGIDDAVVLKSLLKEEGYVEHNNIYIKPNGINGFASVYGTIFNTKVWDKWFPYNNTEIINTFEQIVNRQVTENESIDAQADALREVATAYKAFLYGDISFIKNKYGSMSNARKEIFYDSTTNMSLNSIIADILDKGLYNNPLLNGLILGDPNVSEDMLGKRPQRMKYANAVLEELSEEKNIASLTRMLIDEKEIGVYNGKMVTSKDLADMLLTYGLLKGGNQSVTDILKYFPPVYIKSLGVYDDVINNQEKFKSTEVIRRSFMIQHIQHNPALYYDELIEDFVVSKSDKVGNTLIYKGDTPPAYVVVKGDAIDSYFLYIGSVSNPYILNKIDTLGHSGITEYDFTVAIGKSLTYINQVDDVVEENNITTNEVINQIPNEVNSPINNNNKELNLSLDYSDYINYSGGAAGGDTIWENTGKKIKLGKQVNYRPETLQQLTQLQLIEVEDAYRQAVKDLGRKVFESNTFVGGLVRRDYLQAKAADSIFAISDIILPGEKGKPVKRVRYTSKVNKPIVDGGTGYAVQMGINLGKPVYVYHQGTNLDNKIQVGWYIWNSNNNSFEKVNTPSLTKKFAGIGTREINENGKQAIIDVYNNKDGKNIIINKQNNNQQLDLFNDNNPLEFTLFEEYQEILKEKGVTEEVFNQLLNEFGEDYVIEYINKCK